MRVEGSSKHNGHVQHFSTIISTTNRFADARKSRSRRRGTVVLMMVLGIVTILGCGALAIDYGLLVADKNHAQRACDAASLAGAVQLKRSGQDSQDADRARQIAIATAAQNGVMVETGEVSFANDFTQIRVAARIGRQLLFARALNFFSRDVSAAAVADIAAVDQPGDVMPIGITWETYRAYTQPLDTGPHPLTLIRQNDTIFGPDTFVLYDTRPENAKSPSAMVDQILSAHQNKVKLGQLLTTLNASESATSSKFSDAISEIFRRSAQAPWNDTWTGTLASSNGIRYEEIFNGTARRDNPRVAYLIINPHTLSPINGTYDTPVQGFAPVYIESLQHAPGTDWETVTQMIVRFLPPTFGSEVDANSGAPISGARVARSTG